MSADDLRAFAATWEQAGHRVAALLDGVSAVAALGDDPLLTRAVARGLARAQAMHRRVFLADLSPSDGSSGDDEGPGVSDMIRFGISLGKAARQDPESPNLFVIGEGAESPLAPDVLGSPRWRSLSEQVHQAGGLLLLSVPSHVPQLGSLIGQLDGVVLVGDAEWVSEARVLGEVRNAATMRTPVAVPRKVETAAPPRRKALRVAGIAVAAGVALLAIPQVRTPLLERLNLGAAADTATASPPSLDVLPAVPPRATSNAAWSTEIRFLNSRTDAEAAVTALLDSFPAATFAEIHPAADSASWYRVLLGAFSDSLSAESFLASLRTRGTVPAGGGSVTHVPFALLVDSASDNAMARLRVSGYQGRGLPAYALRDSATTWHIYVGAFPEAADANRLKTQLDSLNIQSALVVRAGSTS